ncbi:unnamed protein product [Lymnaea stagnalis]|uniref:Uncharacterized protein n=1 Tax=Lymnaea stagnalis TaxID=6523 RepID=A0AAV2I8C5_LYMST
MEKGVRNNLSILAEEDDEEENSEESDIENSEEETDSDNEDGNNRGVKIGEQNKFDNLCDGVLNAMALVHDSLHELLEMKDEMLKFSLPPTLLMKVAMISGRMFRSISDLGMPVGELVRLVHVYSTPWEEKSAALKKLHEDYESKQRQLNIAIKRLQLVDAHSKRIAREKRIMNWEKLFSKMTSARGHGRRWKFLIETIKEKAKLGLEHVQAYTQSLAETSESEAEDPTDQMPEEGEVSSQMFHQEATNQSDINEDNKEVEEKENEEEGEKEEKDSSDEDVAGDTEGTESLVSGDTGGTEGDDGQGNLAWISTSPKRVRFDTSSTSAPVRPPMKDVDVWTGEPDYDRSLFIRTFCPEGLRQTELKCSLSYGGKMFKTTLLDPVDDHLDIMSPDMLDERPSKRPQAARKGEERSSLGVPGSSPLNDSTKKNKNKRYFEFEIKLPDEVREGVLSTVVQHLQEPDNLQFAVHKGKYEEIIAMATLDFQDIRKMASLSTVYLPPPHGDDNVAGIKSRANSFSDESSLNAESLSDSVDIPILMDESGERMASSTPREDLVKTSEAIPVPLYSLHSGKSDAIQTPSGTLPLIIYWGKRARPLHFNRQCGTLGVNDLVFELTGLDLDITTKEDLHKDMVDKALSAAAFTPEVEEHEIIDADDQSVEAEQETVPRSEFDKMVERHQEEMVYMQDEYEKHIQELLNNLQAVQSENAQLSQLTVQNQRPVSTASQRPLSTASQRPMSTSSRRGLSSNVTPVTERLMEAPLSDVDHKPVTPQSARNVIRDKTVSDLGDGRRAFVSESMPEVKRPLPPKNMKPYKNFRIGRPLPKWGESLPQDFFERLKLWEDESKQHKDELNEKTLKDIKDSLEKKLAGQHKLSKDEEKIYDALKDVSLPALFMPYKRGNVYNPRAHQYFHPTGATEVRLTQPPSVFQLPPLPNSKFPVVNLFELSKNFHNQGPAWLVERYIQQQQPLNDNGCHTSRHTSLIPEATTVDQAPFTETMDSSSSAGAQVKREVES